MSKVAFAAGFVLVSCCAAGAQARTHVLFTVDVESFVHGDPADQIWGEVAGIGERWGITRIMGALEAAGVRGTFYLNAYEAAQHGGTIRDAAREIHRRGHDLQLHTHPAPMFEVPAMADGGLAVQEDILRTGIKLLHEWTGKTVIAHRAGGFRANLDTLRAAKRAGLLVDSSFSTIATGRHPTVQRGLARNKVQVIEGVVQFPVTHYREVGLGSWSRERLVDLEAATERELRAILDQASRGRLCAVNVLLHSFSLSREGTPDPAMLKRLENVIAYARANATLEIVTTTTLYERIAARDVCDGETEFVPVTGWLLTGARAVEHFDRGGKNRVVVIGAGAIVLLLLAGGAMLLLRRWRR